MADEVNQAVPPVVPDQTVPPTPTPVPAPTEPVAPAPVPAPVVPEPVKEVPKADFYSSASAILEKAGFNPTEVGKEITENGGEISVELYNKFVEKIGKTEADVLVAGYTHERTTVIAKQQEENQKVFDIVGGQEQWNKIAEWTRAADSGLSKEAADVYNEMLAAGGVKAALAANALKEAYMASPGFTPAPNLMQGDGTPAPTGVTPISRSEYIAEKKKAYSANDGVAVAALEARARHTQQNSPHLWRASKING